MDDDDVIYDYWPVERCCVHVESHKPGCESIGQISRKQRARAFQVKRRPGAPGLGPGRCS